MEYYFSVKENRKIEIKIKNSRFICYLQYAETFKQVKHFISEISDLHKNANHNCWAYILGDKGDTFHSSDAGEPSGTAGKPMLHTLQKHKMTNIVCVVTRYFGGTKLGIRGLIDAYSESVETCILVNKLNKIVKLSSFYISTTYDFFEILKHRLSSFDFHIAIKDIEYTADIKFSIEFETHYLEDIQKYLTEIENSGKLIIE